MKDFQKKEILGEIERLLCFDSGGKAELDVSMKKLTTFKIGGPADILYTSGSIEEAAAVIQYLSSENIPYFILGNGSNLLVKDLGYRGIMIKAGDKLSEIKISGNILTAGSGAMLASVASAASNASLSGLEFASGIPGSVGGAITMNAGAYGGEMVQVTTNVTAIMPDGSVKEFGRKELNMHYRHSVFMENGAMIVSASFELKYDDRVSIIERTRGFNEKRRRKQPLDFPSAGSTFKRPEGDFAGRLIEEAGCRDLSYGGAKVSPKHAGFIVNTGNATANDVIELMEILKLRVKDVSGVELEPEIRIIGE